MATKQLVRVVVFRGAHMNHRFRFAPSPTGHLHIGGARTAFYNFLLARKMGGKFILRIEDTDQERSTQEYVQSIMRGMEWIGLQWDEGPYYQTERAAIYQEHIQKLLQAGKAYRCTCSSVDVETMRQTALAVGKKPKYDGRCRNRNDISSSSPHCIRFKSQQTGQTIVKDLIHGEVIFANEELDDFIIARSDGSPTYNFVVVVDDVLMQITHVIRGDDHLNNTPKQMLLYNAFDYPVPVFAHVPMILGSDKKRLSKRHGATSVVAYQEMGFLPEALMNYLVRLGWSHGDEEIFSMQDLIEKFDIGHVGKSAAVFNPEKLLWLNGVYIRSSTPESLLQQSLQFYQQKGILPPANEKTFQAIGSCQEKVKTLLELVDLSAFYFQETIHYDAHVLAKNFTAESKAILLELSHLLNTIEIFTKENLEKNLKEFANQKQIKFNQLALPLRLALTGSTVSPGIYDVLTILGKEIVLHRINCFLTVIPS